MSEHHATICWGRGEVEFRYDSYSRDHDWSFPGGERVAASAAVEYLGSAERVDPEEAFVASLASCHMLTFLAIAARKRLVVDSYRDEAVGFMEKNEQGRLAVTRVVLRPRIEWEGEPPSAEAIEKIHQLSHETCFIANSVRTEIRVESA